MFFRKCVCVFTLVLLLCQIHVCFAERLNGRVRRDDQSDSFSKMFSDFFADLFGSVANTTTTVTPPTNGSDNTSASDIFTGTALQGNTTDVPVNSTQPVPQTTQQEVMSQGNNKTLSNGNTTTESSTVTSQQTEHNNCYDEPLLRDFCQVSEEMQYWTLWDVYYVFFSNIVVNNLIKSCPRATWCLQSDMESLVADQAEMLMDPTSKVSTLCQLDFEPCFSKIVDHFKTCYKYNYFMITFEALKLACGLKSNSMLTSSCYVTVETVFHVTHADLLRDENTEISNDTCQSPEAKMTKALICVENACPGESKLFHGVQPWSWFMSGEDDLMIQCKINPAECQFLPFQANSSTTTAPAQQNQTTSGTTKQQTTASSTWATESTYSTWMYTSDTDSPEPDNCYNDAVLQNYCTVPEDLTDVSFWDLYSVLFSDAVLDALMVGCTKGSWCLKDRFDYWESQIVERVDMVMESDIANSMCKPEVEPCILTVANIFQNCSMYPQMAYTSEVLRLVCGMRQKPDLTEQCYKHTISAAHVTLADILRAPSDDEKNVEDTCQSPEAEMTRNLICVENSCPGEQQNFRSFPPWAWFTVVVNELIEDCDLDPTVCQSLLMRQTADFLEGTVIGIVAAIVITSLVLSVATCAVYKRYRRNAVVKEGYQRLLTEGDES